MTWTTRPRSRIGSLAAIAAGQGPLIVMLHGVGLRAEAWGAQLDVLCRDARVIAFDLPGHGHSDGLCDTIAGAAARVIDAVPDRAVVVGHSMGAMIAVEMAAQAPDQVSAVVALNGIFERDTAAAAAVQARAAALDGQQVPDPAPTLQRWFGEAASDARTACHHWLTSVDPAAYACAYQTFARADGPSRDVLSQLRCPAVFMTGSAEPNSTPAMSAAMADLAPSGRAEIIAGAAHMMPMTHPGAVNATLTQMARCALADCATQQRR